MRKCLIAMIMTVILAVSFADPPQSTNAGAFATEYTQLLNHAQLLLQYIRQAEQLAEAIKQTTDMIKNSRTLPSQVFGPITSDLNALASIVRGGMALSYSLANVDAIFRERFPGYGYGGTAYYLNYRNWSQTTLDTTLGALRAAGLQGKQLDDEQAVLNSVRTMAQSTDGRLGALQVMSQIAEQQVQQLMKLRALMLADMSSKQSYQAAVIQKQAASEAATERFFNWTPAGSDGTTFQAGWK
jgi:P-type conjugative transfer protein TrbJ